GSFGGIGPFTGVLDLDASAFVGQKIDSMTFIVDLPGGIPDPILGGWLAPPATGSFLEIDASFGSPPASNPAGVWKNQPGLWPVSSLTIGGTMYNQDQLLQVLNTPTRGDAVLILADQLIAAELSIKNGSAHSSTTDAKISDADTLLQGIDLLSHGTAVKPNT